MAWLGWSVQSSMQMFCGNSPPAGAYATTNARRSESSSTNYELAVERPARAVAGPHTI